jgi:murein DD-endopeptidase MepM/ murein hydrolase activator NlpD
LVAKLIEVKPHGCALLLMDGIVRAMYSDPAAGPTPLEPDRVYQVTIGLGDICHNFRAGSRIEIDDRFLNRVVPAIASTTPAMNISTEPADRVASFLRINGDLRRQNAATIAEQAKKTAPQMLWTDAFQPLGNASIEAAFADNRTYIHEGKEIDRQVHLGFDLAVTQRIPVLAANTGVVVYAADLGIYGNCVIVDHGLGVQSLYGHLSSIDVKEGDRVAKAQVLGRSGMTGLAAGDHLHFTMLVNGEPVNSVEWWDPKWMQDRVFRKIAEAGGSRVP